MIRQLKACIEVSQARPDVDGVVAAAAVINGRYLCVFPQSFNWIHAKCPQSRSDAREHTYTHYGDSIREEQRGLFRHGETRSAPCKNHYGQQAASRHNAHGDLEERSAKNIGNDPRGWRTQGHAHSDFPSTP